MDLSFVGYAVQCWPVVTGVLYGGVVGLGVWHAVGGMAIVLRRWGSGKTSQEEGEVKRKKKEKSWVGWRANLTVAISSLMAVALVRLRNDAFVTKSLAGRIESVHRKVLWFV